MPRVDQLYAAVALSILCLGSLSASTNSYIPLCYYLVFVLVFLCLVRLPRIVGIFSNLKVIDLIPAAILAMWIYGIFLGIVLGNETAYIVRNNAGIIFYLAYYAGLPICNKPNFVKRILLWAGATVAVFLLIARFLMWWNEDLFGLFCQLVVGEVAGGGAVSGQRLYSFLTTTMLPLLAYSTFRLIDNPAGLGTPIGVFLGRVGVVFILGYLVFVSAGSRGFSLAGLYAVGVGGVFGLARNMRRKRGFPLLLIVSLAILGLVFLRHTGYLSLIVDAFSSQDIGNQKRYEQVEPLMNDLSFLGRGAGAVVPNLLRSATSPYSNELSFLNLFHKYGVLGFLAVLAYVSTFLLGLRQARFLRNADFIVLSLGALGFLFPALGNPVLFSAISCQLHVLALLSLRGLGEKPTKSPVSVPLRSRCLVLAPGGTR